MGRVTSGSGGEVVLRTAQAIIDAEFPKMAMSIKLPDEKSRRVGQSVAAASLPAIR